MARVFFSYSHRDEELRDRLETHLAMLKRENVVEAWHDRRITVGDEWKGQIDANLERSNVILLLVSPDFLASSYCYDVELNHAMRLHGEGKSKVVPIILKPCDWKSAPFSKLQAAPTDGKPIVSWPDLDEAFLNVVEKLRDLLGKESTDLSLGKSRGALRELSSVESNNSIKTATFSGPRSSNLSLSKSFTEAEADEFLDKAFEYMSKFFENSLLELQERNSDIKTSFKRVDSNRFTAVVYKNGSSIARCKISLGSEFSHKSIRFSGNDSLADESYNESLSVKHDKQAMYLSSIGMQQSSQFDSKKLTFEGASEFYWHLLIKYLQ